MACRITELVLLCRDPDRLADQLQALVQVQRLAVDTGPDADARPVAGLADYDAVSREPIGRSDR